MSIAFHVVEGRFEPPSFSAHGVSNLLNWRNDAAGSCETLFKRVSAEIAMVGLAFLAVIEAVIRPIFSVFALFTEGQRAAYHHYQGFKKSYLTVCQMPFFLIENIFCKYVFSITI